MTSNYQPRFIELLQKAGKGQSDLPGFIQELAEKFEKAKQAWELADEGIRERLFPVLVKTDAVIAAEINELYKDRVETQVDKAKLMAMKAKALKLK